MWKKKLLAAALAAGLALSLGTGAAAAALTGRNYVDGNGDGICDNRGPPAPTGMRTATACATGAAWAAAPAGGAAATGARTLWTPMATGSATIWAQAVARADRARIS